MREVSSFQCHRRALDGLAPAAAVARLAAPGAPIGDVLLDYRIERVGIERDVVGVAEDQRDGVAFLQVDLSGQVAAFRDQRRRTVNRERQAALMVEPAARYVRLRRRDGGRASHHAIVEPRRAADSNHSRPAGAGQPADQPRRRVVLVVADRHQVDQIDARRVRHPAGQQDVGLGQIHLDDVRVGQIGLDREMPALVAVEQPREDRRTVEARPTEIVDRARRIDQRDRLQITDRAVIRDRYAMLIHYRGSRDKGSCRRRW
ncbi:hypothetical protein NHF48_021930 [Sphingomonas sp. H160509]|uniref:hypothetical protein n=1 Tax=Sphingomonas sp. H160509 TaxID=2955313 RepID=UPI002097172D|nr:hypothetical protein [Sphingomonas sp. H160509]MDD1452969.1 hypothetical protein [Sphingomonas sp. H160509]